MYLASIIEFVLVGYLELLEDTTPPFKVNMNQDVDL